VIFFSTLPGPHAEAAEGFGNTLELK